MADINTYATELLIDFADAMHKEIQRILEDEYGNEWLARGVRKHFRPEYFARIESMLRNPMRVVDMNQNQDQLHGLEHFWNIVNGNWRLFQSLFGDRKRTEVYLDDFRTQAQPRTSSAEPHSVEERPY